MKKKAIEKIPYITVPAKSRKKVVQFIAMASWKNIGNERHLFLEVYKNKKECLKIPVVRYVTTKKDWGVFFPDSGTWTNQRMCNNTYYDNFCWCDNGQRTDYKDKQKINLLYSEKELNTIKNFFKGDSIWDKERWWLFFERNEDRIKRIRENRKYEIRRERLEKRKKETPELQKSKILEWAKKRIFHEKHLLYYKKKGRFAKLCCSKCGGVTEGAWKAGESYESQFQRRIDEPREKGMGKCPLCGAYGRYKAKGKVKGTYSEEAYAYTVDKYHEKGIVIRYMQLQHSWHLEELLGDKGEPEMNGAYEEYSGIEIAREYLEPGKKTQRDFNKHNPYSGKDFWDDCNLYGLSNIQIRKGYVHPDAFAVLNNSYFKYSCLNIYAAEVGKMNAMDYLERYRDFPQIEILLKMGLIDIVQDMVKGYCGIIENVNAKSPDEFLGINKSHIKLLISEKGNHECLKVLKLEKTLKLKWTDVQIRNLTYVINNIDRLKFENAIRYMSTEQFINRIQKYAGTEFEMVSSCSKALSQMKSTVGVYLDYLQMRTELGYDLNNSVYAYPRNLEEAHKKMVMEQNKNEMDARLKQVEENYPEIKKQYRSNRKRYFFEDENYVIRPARSASEIVMEGRILHHCVGGDGYLRKHNKGESYILMLRYKKKPEIPYITIEIKQNSIIQWYGAQDKKPDEKNIQRWIDAYVMRLKCEANDAQNIVKIAAAV